ncbi:Arm DNA-binding domain-containing protein [Ochrobactrum sp. EDr1-4]|uniref:Arm DNA-binding domain-containing protein n=1 Tax=Ochrobactrum sp. EDr1-4 TaxID=3368622 RepID=UPI003BA03827
MLTDAAIKRAKSKDKSYHQTHSNGLSILIMPTGSKVWRYRYRFDSKAKMISFGPYPEVSLA